MRKTDKKLDNEIRKALTQACEIALEQHTGFQWLTHIVNYDNFPASLRVICVFATNQQLLAANKTEITNLITTKLGSINVPLKTPSKHISFDSEENCSVNHNGKWGDRLH
ncbi:hypothetical protein FE810_15650 [Thalassotalea litorea]|uniref:Fis family transcriptional regulator n=1 Tax=Thalassotalea litorea TaxID=2020715 RepID=A0A5R9IEW9_9GAMM|nr:hypothetical protein [Thalassotalea litorea]TLU61104.1 hypothetical protein FE810_15650 [Thalassotalea litorea]